MSFSFDQTTPLGSWSNTTFSLLLNDTDDKDGIGKRSLPEIIIWAAFLIMIVMASLVGNMFVIACVLLNHRLRDEQANMFIVNLSVTDMCSAVIVMCSSLYGLISDEWLLGQVWCDIVCGANYTLIIVSMLTLCFISLDRYFAILHALHYHSIITRKKIYFAVIYAWFQGLCFGLAPIMARWIRFDYWEIVCAIVWHEDSSLTLIYVIIAFAVCFLLPGTVLVIAYCKIMKVAKAHNDIHPQNLDFRPHEPGQRDTQTTTTASHGSLGETHENDNGCNSTTHHPSQGDSIQTRHENIVQDEESPDAMEEDTTVSRQQGATARTQSTGEIKAGYPHINDLDDGSKRDTQSTSQNHREEQRPVEFWRNIIETNKRKWTSKVEDKRKYNSMEMEMLNGNTNTDVEPINSLNTKRPNGVQNNGFRRSFDFGVDSEQPDTPRSSIVVTFDNVAQSVGLESNTHPCSSGIQHRDQTDYGIPLNSAPAEARTLSEATNNNEDLDKLPNSRPGHFSRGSETGRSEQITTVNQHRRQSNKNNKRNYSSSSKAVKSLLIVVMAYFICMTPFSITKLYKVVVPVQDAIPGYVNLIATIFQYCSSAINPLIYGVFRKDFQRAFVLLLRKAFSRIRNRDLSNSDFNSTW